VVVLGLLDPEDKHKTILRTVETVTFENNSVFSNTAERTLNLAVNKMQYLEVYRQ
jgi:hypothetical protein